MAEGGKLVWAYATYVFMMLAYTFINVPYGALLGVVTSSSQDRTALASFRFIGAFSGGTLVAYTTPILVDFFGGADKALGWQLTMGLYGAVAAFLFASTFFATKERVVPIQKEATPVLQDIKDLTKNGPWLTLLLLLLSSW